MRTVHGQYRRRTKIPKENLDLSSDVLQAGNGGEEGSKGKAGSGGSTSDTSGSTSPEPPSAEAGVEVKMEAEVNER